MSLSFPTQSSAHPPQGGCLGVHSSHQAAPQRAAPRALCLLQIVAERAVASSRLPHAITLEPISTNDLPLQGTTSWAQGLAAAPVPLPAHCGAVLLSPCPRCCPQHEDQQGHGVPSRQNVMAWLDASLWALGWTLGVFWGGRDPIQPSFLGSGYPGCCEAVDPEVRSTVHRQPARTQGHG